MTFRYYDVLEETLNSIDRWRDDDSINKDDVLDSTRERILMLMTHVITTPLIGTAYAYPGDIKSLDAWLSSPSSVDPSKLSPVDDVINTTSTKNSQPVVVSRD
jgi:hypothetical protein